MSGHFESGANRLVRLSAPSEAALAAFTAEQATLAKQQQQRQYSGGDGIGSESGEDAAPDPRVNSKLARGPDGTRGFHSRTGRPPSVPTATQSEMESDTERLERVERLTAASNSA